MTTNELEEKLNRIDPDVIMRVKKCNKTHKKDDIMFYKGYVYVFNIMFDDKGYSYEVTRREKKIIDSYQRFKHPQPNDLDYWINSGLFCPVCKADSKSIDLLGKAIENG